MLIGDVSRLSGISVRMLRHYDALGLVSPGDRTSGGYRDYTEADLRRLVQVESLRSLGLGLAEAKRALDDPAFAPAALVDELITSARTRIERERELLARLRRVRAGDPDAWTDVLRLVALLRRLESAEPSKRQRAVLSTAGSAGIPATALAEAVLRESDPNVAGALRWALARTEGEEALPVLERALGSPDEHTRRRAVTALAKLAAPAASEVLATALRDPDAEVRSHAALALGARGTDAAVPELVDMIVRGELDVEAAEVLGALARRHGMEADIVDRLRVELGAREASVSVRVRLAQSLGEIPVRPRATC